MRTLISAHRYARVCVAEMDQDSREYIRSFFISAALVTLAAALPLFHPMSFVAFMAGTIACVWMMRQAIR